MKKIIDQIVAEGITARAVKTVAVAVPKIVVGACCINHPRTILIDAWDILTKAGRSTIAEGCQREDDQSAKKRKARRMNGRAVDRRKVGRGSEPDGRNRTRP